MREVHSHPLNLKEILDNSESVQKRAQDMLLKTIFLQDEDM